jgi:glycosyltransferase involved in cell wall biosynthesis
MKIAVVGPSPVPYAYGGAESLFWMLVESINDLTEHNAELIKLPVKEQNFWDLIDSYRSFYRLDLSHFDMIISTKYPAWMVQHRNHIIYLQHHLRGLFDTYHFCNEPIQTPESLRIGMVDEILKTIKDPNAKIESVFNMLDELKGNKTSYDPASFKFPGPFIRELVHYFDAYALSPKRIRKYYCISNNVKTREDYFPLGVSVEAIPHPSKLEGLRCRGHNYIFTASRLDGPKRINAMVEAMLHVHHDIHLKIAGTGPDEIVLKEMAKGDNRIEFLGFVNDKALVDLYSNALAVLYIPYDEDYGLITFEAMKSKKPLITASDSGGPLEFVKDSVTGYIVPPDPKKLAVKINHLVEHPEEARILGSRAFHAVQDITWERLVARLIDTNIVRQYKRSKILVLCTYSCYPPRGGGQHRLYNLYSLLAKNFDVTICSIIESNKPYQNLLLENGLRQICIPQTREHAEAQWEAERRTGVNLYDVCMIDLIEMSNDYVQTARNLINESDIIIFSHPYLFGLIKYVEKNKRVVYESHNIEYLLKRDYIQNQVISTKIREIEKEACTKSDIILTTSEEDKSGLVDIYSANAEKIIVAPNGVDTSKIQFIDEDEKTKNKSIAGLLNYNTILFVGSWHPPNLEALEFIVDKLANKLDDCVMLVIGSVRDYYLQKHKVLPKNVMAFGTIDEEEKYEVYKLADIAINPMFSGSGTNLKMLDYMSAGIPAISTEIGARGLNALDSKQVLICTPDQIHEKIRNLLANKNLKDNLRRSARTHVVEFYSWEKIANNVEETLKKLM